MSNWKTLQHVNKAVHSAKKAVARKKKDKGESAEDILKKDEKKAAEPSAAEKKQAFASFVYETLKTVFDLVTINDEIMVNIDNVFPLMKTLDLDTKDEAILDMVRTACIETYGDIDELEFDKAIVDLRKRTVEDEFEEDVKSAFSVIDVDEDGYINASDVYQLMMGLGDMLTDDELNDIVKAADMDGDGQISYRDFKYFLLGVLDPEVEEQPPEETAEEEKKEDQEQTDKKEGEGEGEKTEESAENKTEAEETPEDTRTPEEIAEEQAKIAKEEEERARLREKRKRSILWGYTKKEEPKEPVKEEKPETQAEQIPTGEDTKDKDAGETTSAATADEKEKAVDDAGEEKVKEEADAPEEETEENDADDTRSVISVTVKQLDSIQEEETEDDSAMCLTHRTPRRSRRRPDSASTPRMRPSSGRLSRPSSGRSSDAGIDVFDEAEEDQSNVFDDNDDESSRPSSRCTSARSRMSSARRRRVPSDVSEHDTESEGISALERSESRQSISCQTIISQVSNDDLIADKRLEERFQTTHSYVEAGTEDLDRIDVKSILEFHSCDSTPRTPPPPVKKTPKLLRAKSAGKLRTIKQIESQLFRRQSTAPQLDREALRLANESLGLGWENRMKVNANGYSCSHIDINLSVDHGGSPKGKVFRPNSPPRLRRPKTATTFNETRRRVIAREKVPDVDYKKYDSGIDSPDTDEDKNVTVVDLSKYLGRSAGYPEDPDQSLQHHGYKSVWPLARVLSAYDHKHNDGKGIKLNSISRRLERSEIPQCWNERDSPNKTINASLSSSIANNHRPQTSIGIRPKTSTGVRRTQSCRVSSSKGRYGVNYVDAEPQHVKTGIVNLQLPFTTNSRTRYKRISPLTGMRLSSID